MPTLKANSVNENNSILMNGSLQNPRDRIQTLNLEQLENLGEALLDFTSMADLQAWLEAK
jgi:dsRNA-specific ribonuclease